MSAEPFDAVSGVQLAKLLPFDVAPGDKFGGSVDMDDGMLAVGAAWSDVNGFDSGAVYLFDVATASQTATILPEDGLEKQLFGWDVSIDKNVLAVGTYRSNYDRQASGYAYVFNAATGTQIVKLFPSVGSPDDLFGIAMSIDDGMVAVGSWGDNKGGEKSGSAYVFQVPLASCLADINADNVLDLGDINAFVAGYLAGDLVTDMNCDAILDLADISGFVSAFLEGC